MKTLLIISLCLSTLLLAGSAHAYAIYNHTDQKACINKVFGIGCHITVEPHSKYNGEHGAGLCCFVVRYTKDHTPYASFELSIPKGGFIRIYDKEVKVYDHQDQHLKTIPIRRVEGQQSQGSRQ